MFIDRKLQLDLINNLFKTNFELNEIDKINFFNEILNELQVKTDEKFFPNTLFFFYDDTAYMQLDTITYQLWCSYEHIWYILKIEFNMEHNDIQSFIKERMEQYFKNVSVIPLTNSVPFIIGASPF